MSKQDRTYTRTAADLERKFAFGQTFAEVYDLVADAQKAATEANAAVDNLDKTLTSKEIFNRLTGYKNLEGVFRDVDDQIYINASYIYGEILEGDDLKVAAANITGKLTADQIDATNLTVNAANITGTLTAGVLQASLNVLASAVKAGTISAGSIDGSFLTVDAAHISGVLDATQLQVDAACISGSLTASNINIIDALSVYDTKVFAKNLIGYFGYMNGADAYGATDGLGFVECVSGTYHGVIATEGGAKLFSDSGEIFCGENVRLTTSGYIYAGGDIIGTSDRRLKENINYDVDRYLAVFDALKPITFSWKEKANKDKHFGFVAQDVEEARDGAGIPAEDFALLNIREDGTYGLAYTEFVPLLVAKVQQLDAEIKELKNNG